MYIPDNFSQYIIREAEEARAERIKERLEHEWDMSDNEDWENWGDSQNTDLKGGWQYMLKRMSEKKRAKRMKKRDKERYNSNEIDISCDILLYDKNKVTLEDCITMKEKYELEAVINDGSILGFTCK